MDATKAGLEPGIGVAVPFGLIAAFSEFDALSREKKKVTRRNFLSITRKIAVRVAEATAIPLVAITGYPALVSGVGQIDTRFLKPVFTGKSHEQVMQDIHNEAIEQGIE